MVTVCNERSAPPVTPEALEVLAFNMERGIYLEALGDFLAHFRPDLILASELDVGCARSGGLDIPRELARRPDSPIPTRRKHMPGRPPLELRLDWLLLRGCGADDAQILSAKREDCPFLKSSFPAEELSDHDAVAAKIYL